MQGKVEICGVNTSRLKTLSQAEMNRLLRLARAGDEQARQTLMAAEGIGQLIADAQRKPSGKFRLGILPTIAPYLLPRCFPKLCKDFPQLDLRVKEMKTQPIKEALLSGDIDAAVIVRTEDTEGLRLTPLFF